MISATFFIATLCLFLESANSAHGEFAVVDISVSSMRDSKEPSHRVSRWLLRRPSLRSLLRTISRLYYMATDNGRQ